jgi:transglutaminase superfamily protein
MARVPQLREFPLLLRTTTLVCTVRLALWLVPFSILRRILTFSTQIRFQAANRYSPEQLSYAVRAVSRYVPRATCLTQALALHILLRQYGWQSRIRIGVNKDAGHFESHAWVESQNRVVIGDSGMSRFVPMMVWD